VKCLGVRIVVGRHQRFGGGGELGEEPRAGRCGGVDAAVGVVHTMVPSGCWRTVQPVWKVLSR